MSISIYSILPLISSTTSLFLGILVFLRNKKSPVNRVFLLFCLFCFIWLFSYALCYSTNNQKIAAILARIACSAVISVPVAIYNLFIVFLNIRKKKTSIYLAYGIALTVLPLSFFTDYFISGVNQHFWGYYAKIGDFYIFYVALFSFYMVKSLLLLIKAIRARILPPHQHLQAKYFLLGFAIAYFGSIDFLPKFNIEIYPFGSVFLLLWVITMSYAILKHQLPGINIVMRKGLIYSSLIAVLTIFYLLIIILIERIFQNVFGYQSLIISLLYATIIAISFIPLKNKIQYLVDKLFYKGTQEEIAQENLLLRQEVEQSEKFKAVATLASGVAHEIKNPLTAIKTFFEHFPEKRDDPEFLNKFTKIVGNEINRIDDLTRQLLEFAKPAPLHLRDTDIRQSINHALSLSNNQLNKQNIKVIKDFDDNTSLSIKADPNKLEQVFINLIFNTIDAMPDGGQLLVKTRIKGRGTGRNPRPLPSNPKILKSSNPCFIQITIQDTGCGIAKEDIPHLFDPFFSRKENGTGLGLAIVQGIVQEHGGMIKIESEVGVGSKFIIDIQIG